MSDLEELGLLYQPHTSAGRIPTEKGFRFYVDYLLNVHELSDKEQQMIRSRYLGHLRPRQWTFSGRPPESSLHLPITWEWSGPPG